MSIRRLAWIISAITIILSIDWYIKRSIYWYYPAVIGVWLQFDNLSNLYKNKTTLDLIVKRNYRKFFSLYVSLAILGILIEFLGVNTLALWSFPYLTVQIWAISVPIMYPFILMSFKEMYCLIYSFFKNKISSILIAMILGFVIWEIPNMYSGDWVYTIDYFIVFVGWYLIIIGPLYVYKLLSLENYFFR